LASDRPSILKFGSVRWPHFFSAAGENSVDPDIQQLGTLCRADIVLWVIIILSLLSHMPFPSHQWQ